MKYNALRTVIVAGFLIILLLPVFNLPPYFSPPDWGKSITFRILFLGILTCAALFALKTKFNPVPEIRKLAKPVKLPILILGLLLISLSISSLFAADLNFALWGNPMRGGGLINFVLLAGFSLFLFCMFSPKEWNKAWLITIITGFVVALFAIFQWQGWFSNIFVEKMARPMSTMGNDIQLGIYLALLSFPALAFALTRKKMGHKIAFGIIAFLFLFVLGLTGSRGAYIAMGAGLFSFAILFPFKSLWHSLAVKFAFLAIMLVPLSLLYYVNVNPEGIYKFSATNPRLAPYLDRFNLRQIMEEPRFSAWQVGWNAIKDKPVFGWGMEHFALAFDKHYDPQLPNIQYIANSSNSWWDRAHNMFVDMGVQGGFLGLGLYLLFLGTLFWQLQKVKNKGGPYILWAHAIQSALISYIFAVFFGFDTFSTYLLLFLIIGYALHVISQSAALPREQQRKQTYAPLSPLRIGLMALIFVLYIAFTWQYNLKPMNANAHIQLGTKYMKEKNPVQAIDHAEKAITIKSTPIDGYLRAKYFDMIRDQTQLPGVTSLQIAQKGYLLLEETTKLWPYHTRNWIFWGQLANLVIERSRVQNPDQDYSKLTQISHQAFARAQELSPRHQEIYLEWTKTYIVAKDFKGAKAKAEECIAIDPRTGECWWLKAVAEVALKEKEEALQDMEAAQKKGFKGETYYAQSQLAKAYDAIKDYAGLAEVYEKLGKLKADPQIYAVLAAVYKELGQFQKAREAALKVLELDPSTKAEVEEFLKTLR